LLALGASAMVASFLFGTATAAAQTFDDPSGDVLPCTGECGTRDQDLKSVSVESSGGQVTFTVEQYGAFTDAGSCRCFFPQLHVYLGSTTLAKPDYYTSVLTGTFPYPIGLFDRSQTQTGIGVNNCPIPSGFNRVGLVAEFNPPVTPSPTSVSYTFNLGAIGNPASFDWRVAEPGASTCQTQGNPEPNPRDVVPDTGLASFGGGGGGGGGGGAIAAAATAPKNQRLSGNKVVVEVEIAADEAVTVEGSGKITVNPTYKLKPKTAEVAAGETKTLRLKPKKKAQATKITDALKQGDKATAKLTVKLTNQAGSTLTENLKVKLKR
jgi:hypothetical protein